ncbi:hypothetical protein IW261DRAFT_1680003 [Armillaria novae-zelandiae]|uniref:Uncharacterized protein n=1 Tax=Armillaria novae-zelandiae TaxID=153914 RepID=A0AA39NL73_9AGAR|nr:hypothetical protein IW261DRAFT_1680003 [Armillaria novae-zelandiae]
MREKAKAPKVVLYLTLFVHYRRVSGETKSSTRRYFSVAGNLLSRSSVVYIRVLVPAPRMTRSRREDQHHRITPRLPRLFRGVLDTGSYGSLTMDIIKDYRDEHELSNSAKSEMVVNYLAQLTKQWNLCKHKKYITNISSEMMHQVDILTNKRATVAMDNAVCKWDKRLSGARANTS